MNYVQFHVGDWDSSTRLLSPLEKGVYIDLLMLYYSVERPLMRSECERISRAYAPEEKAALEYVLDRFFHREGDVYAHRRCDEEIAKAAEKSEKAAKSAQARWNKGSRGKKASDANANDMQNGCTCNADADANGMQTHSERNADAMLTNNQEPITNKETERKKKSGRQSRTHSTSTPCPKTGGRFASSFGLTSTQTRSLPASRATTGSARARTPCVAGRDGINRGSTGSSARKKSHRENQRDQPHTNNLKFLTRPTTRDQ